MQIRPFSRLELCIRAHWPKVNVRRSRILVPSGKSEERRALVVFVQTRKSLAKRVILKTMTLWSRWSSKGRSPKMRHVSGTHRVDLDWLFDQINLDPVIQFWICWHHKANRRHPNKRILHCWEVGQTDQAVQYNGPLATFLQPFGSLLFCSSTKQCHGTRRKKKKNRAVSQNRDGCEIFASSTEKYGAIMCKELED